HAEPAANPAPGRRARAGARRPADGLYPLTGPPKSNTLHYGAGREGGSEAISIEMKWQEPVHARRSNGPRPRQGANQENAMPGRNSFLAWNAGVCWLSVVASCGVAAAQGAAPPPAVSVTPVVTRQITESSDYVGRVAAVDKVDLVARVSGFLGQRNFTEGQAVKKGDLLFRIEQATYKAAVDQARAAVARAKATEVNAKLQLERGKELVRSNNIPQATVDQREADEQAAQASVMEAQ